MIKYAILKLVTGEEIFAQIEEFEEESEAVSYTHLTLPTKA